jgi:hypothetical protein
VCPRSWIPLWKATLSCALLPGMRVSLWTVTAYDTGLDFLLLSRHLIPLSGGHASLQEQTCECAVRFLTCFCSILSLQSPLSASCTPACLVWLLWYRSATRGHCRGSDLASHCLSWLFQWKETASCKCYVKSHPLTLHLQWPWALLKWNSSLPAWYGPFCQGKLIQAPWAEPMKSTAGRMRATSRNGVGTLLKSKHPRHQIFFKIRTL